MPSATAITMSNGFSNVADAEAQDFLRAHPDLYTQGKDAVQLAVRDGAIKFSSLGAAPGFASGIDPRHVGQAATEIQPEIMKDYGT